jgi:CDP-glucose 4,6-dehydratase
VEWIVRQLAELWGEGAHWEQEVAEQPHEAHTLKLDWSKAHHRLAWHPALRLQDALVMSAEWYKRRLQEHDMHEFTITQIENYEDRCNQALAARVHLSEASGVQS